MCGLVGGFYVNKQIPIDLLKEMTDTIVHRGPDQYGHFISEDGKFGLGHRRLAIHDLSSAGQQPMKSYCGRYVIVFNGEIYNFDELREQLSDDIFWRGSSDTEVLINALSSWGVGVTLPLLNGMFAIAVFDLEKNILTLARDRFGEKPLYIYSNNDSFSFSSELKPLEIFTNRLSLNQSAVDSLLKYSYIPAPYSVYNEVFKLLPGHYLNVDLNNYKKVALDKMQPFWKIRDVIVDGFSKRDSYSDITEALDETESVLNKSVKERMVSDVPLGAFLSGGIDSTCITALMQNNSIDKVKTFSIGFYDENYNEAQHAKVVSEILGTDHHELYLNAHDMLDYVPKLSSIYDEPFADSSQLPTLMVSNFAKKHVTVALTGDCGDEVFCGYNRYVYGQGIVDRVGHVPKELRALIGKSATKVSPLIYDKLIRALSDLLPRLKKYKRVGDNIHKLARVIDFKDEADLYRKLILTWPNSALSYEVHDLATDIQEAFGHVDLSLAERMMWQDALGYMQNDILTKVDRASMSVSLETRVPFLDNNVYQHAWSLPIEYKMNKGITKLPLRKIISKYIPDDVINRPKSGFGVPIDSWLRSDLRGWADDLLETSKLDSVGFLDTSLIRNTWENHISGKSNQQYALWNVLMFMQWNES
ncbi:asparagine synthase (glutamine-hydrolyzing) [Vibrio chagasii]|uniref:asparagine synthase (glutamine-hydrolyzing) n=1 Tax=Vibrio chagasii TaxID=170679 RepID=UPI0040676CAF